MSVATMPRPTAREATKPKRIEGAIPYNVWSTDISTTDNRSFKERLQPGCFADSLRAITNGEQECRFKLNHGFSGNQDGYGSTADGRLKLTDTPDALLFALSIPPDDADATELYRRANSPLGGLGGVSFAFRTDADSWSTDGRQRTILRARLSDVSLVTDPAYPSASFELRTLAIRLGRLFHSSDADPRARHAGAIEYRLGVECAKLPASIRAGVAERTRAEFLQTCALNRWLDQRGLIELRCALEEIGPTT